MRGAERGGARLRIDLPNHRGFKPNRLARQSSQAEPHGTNERRARGHMFMPPQIASVDERLRVRSRRDICESRSNGRSVWGFYSGDRPLAANEEPPLGAHLITSRFAYTHHGVYVGAGAVVHYGAFAHHWHRGPVEEVSLSRFAQGHSVWVRPVGLDALQCEEIVRRARSRLGENRYRLLSNNCEHFSEWCIHGEHRSAQAEQWLARLRGASRPLREVMRWLTVASLRRSASPPLSMASASRVLCTRSPRVTVRVPRPTTPVAGPLYSSSTFQRAPSAVHEMSLLRGLLTERSDRVATSFAVERADD